MSKLASCLVMLMAAAGLLATPVRADKSLSHEEARRLVQEGKIRPLEEIIAILREKIPGQLLETELEYEDGVLVYDFKILRPGGKVQEVEVHPSTGRILKVEDDD